MKTAPTHEENGAAVRSDRSTAKPSKASVIAEALLAGSLNRFEAEDLGDHVLPSTVSELRKSGITVHGAWEKVGTRFGVEAKVMRYSIPKTQAGKVERLRSRRA